VKNVTFSFETSPNKNPTRKSGGPGILCPRVPHQIAPMKSTLNFIHMKLRGGGVARSGQSTPKWSSKKLVKDNFASQRKIRFDMFMWCQARWFGRSIKTFLTRSRADPRNSVYRSVIAKHQKPFSSSFSLGKEARWVFIGKLVIYFYSIRNLFQLLLFNTTAFWKTPEPTLIEERPNLQQFPKVFKCTGLCRSFIHKK